MLATYGVDGPVRWAIAGRSNAKLDEVRKAIGAPDSLAVITANASDPASQSCPVLQDEAQDFSAGGRIASSEMRQHARFKHFDFVQLRNVKGS
jgi:hypothetical protein